MKAFGLFNMFAAYACSIMSAGTVVYQVAYSHQYGNAVIMSLAGAAMFIIAETLKKEWREGKL